MKKLKLRLPSTPMMILICLLISPTVAWSQCNVTNTGMTTFPTLIIVSKTLATADQCTLTMMNASFCFPSYTPATTAQLVASALTATTNPSCGWVCGCGSVTIDGSDGLPVELMGFSVEGDQG